MYNFIVQSYSCYRGLFHWLNWGGYISGTILQPFATVIMFTVLGRFTSNPDMVKGYALGIAVTGMTFILIGGITQSYARERSAGATQFVFVSTTNRFVNYLARMTLHFPNGIVSFFFGMLAAWLIVDLDFGAASWGGFVAALLALTFSITAFAQFLGVISVYIRDWVGIQGLGNALLLVLCGVIIPVTAFPGSIQEFAKILPVTNGLVALKGAFAGTPLGEIFRDILREAITGIAYNALAFFSFLLFENFTKRTGTLERDTL